MGRTVGRLLAAALAAALGCGNGGGEPRPGPALEPAGEGPRPAAVEAEDGAGPDAGPARAEGARAGAEGAFPLHGVALFHQLNVQAEPSASSERLGYLRRGSRLRVGPEVEGRGCREGRWHPTSEGGYVCSGRALRLGESPPELGFTPRPADLDAPTPYEYGFNRADDVPLYRRLPTKGEMRAEEERRRALLAAKQPPPDAGAPSAELEGAPGPEQVEAPAEEEGAEERPTGPIVTRLRRGFYLTMEGFVEHNGRRWLRTADLTYVAAEGISRRAVPDIRGVELGGELSLPIAIVYQDGARTKRPGKGGRLEAGRELERFAVVPIVATTRIGAQDYHATGQGDFVPADRVRRVDPMDPPPDIGPDERWIEVDLSEQFLVAHEGSRPVYATLVATGKPGFETPPGEYRITSKHVSTNMSDAPAGDDPYLIQDVPWTMYFQGAYALHGAFWHSRFGRERSHGCVNLAPADARWIFMWVGPRLPEGWHGVTSTVENPGTRVFIHD